MTSSCEGKRRKRHGKKEEYVNKIHCSSWTFMEGTITIMLLPDAPTCKPSTYEEYAHATISVHNASHAKLSQILDGQPFTILLSPCSTYYN